MSKNTPKQPDAGAAPEGATAVADPADAVAAAQAAAQFAGQAQAAAERIQSAMQDLAVQIAATAKDAQDVLAQAKALMAEAIESHNTVVATLESDADARDAAALLAVNSVSGGAAAPPAMTAAEAAALVRRRKVIEAPGAQPRVIESPIGADEVLAFTDHGTHVVVVTVDGQKFSTADAA